jgi:glucuronoarabinoxylan endo-1,4-beta-xylanase
VVILSGDTTLRADADEPRAALPSDLHVTVFPNPFNYQTTIRVDVPVFAARLDLSLYNLLGQAVQEATLRNVLGMTQYHFDAGALATGVYLLRVQAGSLINTQKLMVLR